MELEWIARLVVAGILGALVGFEREKRFKEAGFRTHFLVAVGSALAMIVSKYAFNDVLHDGTVELDPSRIAAQIVSGVGFLGAGTILVQRQSVRGLTTAAGLWATAGIGMTVGAGMYVMGVCGTALVLLGLEVLNRMFKSVFPKFHKLTVQVQSNESIPDIIDSLTAQQLSVTTYQVRVKGTDNEPVHSVHFQLRTNRTIEDNQILKALQALPEVESVKFD
jgi:putative Mg2+ transporter-C (MgtC) family protein